MSVYSNDEEESLSDNDIKNYSWMIRSENAYREESRSCLLLRGRLNQYYYNGRINNCQEWLIPFTHVRQLNKNDGKSDEKHDLRKELVKFELKRRKCRAEKSLANNVWEYREKPPDDWNEPLPDFMNAKEGSHLEQLQKSWKNNRFSYDNSRCILM